MARRLWAEASGLILAILVGVGCEPPPAVDFAQSDPSITLLGVLSGVDTPLTRADAGWMLDLQLSVDIDGVVFVPPSEAAGDVPGEGRFRFSVNGSRVEEPETRFFTYRSAVDQFLPGDTVRLSVDLVSNTGDNLDGAEGWTDEVTFPLVAPPESTAELRLVHASPDAGALDVYVDGSTTPLFSDLAFGEASAWQRVIAEPLRLAFRPAGSDPSASPLFTDILDPEEGQRVNAVAGGFIGGLGGGSFRVLSVVEGWGNDVPGRARVRWVHAGADLPAFAVDGAGFRAPLIVPFSAGNAAGVTLGIAGGVQLELLTDGDPGASLTSFTTPTLADGDEVLLIATGRLGALPREPEGLRLLAIGPEGPLDSIEQDPQLFVLHGSGDSGSLELCDGNAAVAANVLFGEMVPARVSPGTYDLTLFNYPAGCTGSALNGTGNRTTFEPGERYLMLLAGEQTPDPGEAGIQAAAFLDDFTLGDPDRAKVKFVHGASYTQVYVGVVADNTITAANVLTAPIQWRSASVEVSVGPGAITVGIADAEGEPPPPYTPIATFDYAAFGGERQWGIVAGDPTPDDEDDRPLQVLVVDSAPAEWTVALVDVQ